MKNGAVWLRSNLIHQAEKCTVHLIFPASTE